VKVLVNSVQELPALQWLSFIMSGP